MKAILLSQLNTCSILKKRFCLIFGEVYNSFRSYWYFALIFRALCKLKVLDLSLKVILVFGSDI